MPKRKVNSLLKPVLVISFILLFAVLLFQFKKGFFQKKPALKSAAVINLNEPESVVQPQADTVKSSEGIKKPVQKKIVKKQIKKPDESVAKSVEEPKNNDNPVMKSVKIGDTEELKRLLDEGNSPNVASGSSSSPLHEAVKLGSTDQVQLLLEKGANPNIRDSKGDTPLHYALRDDAVFMVDLLLKHGANPDMTDRSGKSPLRIASSIDSELEKMLRKYGAK